MSIVVCMRRLTRRSRESRVARRRCRFSVLPRGAGGTGSRGSSATSFFTTRGPEPDASCDRTAHGRPRADGRAAAGRGARAPRSGGQSAHQPSAYSNAPTAHQTSLNHHRGRTRFTPCAQADVRSRSLRACPCGACAHRRRSPPRPPGYVATQPAARRPPCGLDGSTWLAGLAPARDAGGSRGRPPLVLIRAGRSEHAVVVVVAAAVRGPTEGVVRGEAAASAAAAHRGHVGDAVAQVARVRAEAHALVVTPRRVQPAAAAPVLVPLVRLPRG